jgi:hypothetical protein
MTDTRFKPGQSGNPAGRPKGSRHKTTLAVEALLEGEAEAIARKAIEKAMEGDIAAIRICLDRLAPPVKDRPVSFKLPAMEKAADAVKAASEIVREAAAGELTPREAGEVMKIIDVYVRTHQAADIEERVERLECAMKGKPGR